ncbi:TdcF protein [Streptococcus pneumoniae]|nr:TdcF protein [Streptococcus pneumoniae]
MAKTIHTDKAPKAIGPYVQGKSLATFCLLAVKFPYPLKLGKL